MFEFFCLIFNKITQSLENVLDCQVFETNSADLVSIIQSRRNGPFFSNLLDLDETALFRVRFVDFSLSLILQFKHSGRLFN